MNASLVVASSVVCTLFAPALTLGQVRMMNITAAVERRPEIRLSGNQSAPTSLTAAINGTDVIGGLSPTEVITAREAGFASALSTGRGVSASAFSSAQADGPDWPYAPSARSPQNFAEAAFGDGFQINVAGASAGTGRLHGYIETSVSSLSDESGPAYASSSAWFVASINGTTVPVPYATDAGFVMTPFDVSVPFNSPMGFSLYGSASASSGAGTNSGDTPDGHAWANIVVGIAWGGITGVTLDDGTPVSYTITNDRGVDYMTADAITPARSVTQLLPGDASLDGKVDFADLLILARHYRQASDNRFDVGDFDGDGTVDFSDLLALARNYGTGTSSTSAASFAADWQLAQSLAPEPASLAVAGGAIAMARRRRRPIARA